jgi:tetratricopeptide (TPR) repeat protein
MTSARVLVIAMLCTGLGIGIGYAAKPQAPGIDVIRGKPDKEAGLAALVAAEQLAGSGSWELLAVGRVYYLSGDKAHGQALFDRVTATKPAGSDWQRLGAIYAEAGEAAKAEECYQKVLALNPKDDTGQAEIGAWYLRNGQRARGEELLAMALQRHPDEMWHYVRAAEALLGVAPGH